MLSLSEEDHQTDKIPVGFEFLAWRSGCGGNIPLLPYLGIFECSNQCSADLAVIYPVYARSSLVVVEELLAFGIDEVW